LGKGVSVRSERQFIRSLRKTEREGVGRARKGGLMTRPSRGGVSSMGGGNSRGFS